MVHADSHPLTCPERVRKITHFWHQPSKSLNAFHVAMATALTVYLRHRKSASYAISCDILVCFLRFLLPWSSDLLHAFPASAIRLWPTPVAVPQREALFSSEQAGRIQSRRFRQACAGIAEAGSRKSILPEKDDLKKNDVTAHCSRWCAIGTF